MNVEIIFKFLNALSHNNNRDWMQKNKNLYTEAKQNFLEILEIILTKIANFDPKIQDLDPKKYTFKINRDIRFTKDKTPYKKHFGAFISIGNKTSGHAGYYIQLQPEDQSFIAGGMYAIEPRNLKLIRNYIDNNSESFLRVIKNKDLVYNFGSLENTKLKSYPRGYKASNPNIELLKYTSYIFSKNIKDSTVLNSKKLINTTAELCKALRPFNDFLNKIVFKI